MKKTMRYGMAAAALTLSVQAHSGLMDPTCSIQGYACIVGQKGSAGQSGAMPGQALLSSPANANPGLIPPPAFNEGSPAYNHLVQSKGGPAIPASYASCGASPGGVSCSGTASLDEAAAVPAPATLALMVLGLAGLLTQRRSGK